MHKPLIIYHFLNVLCAWWRIHGHNKDLRYTYKIHTQGVWIIVYASELFLHKLVLNKLWYYFYYYMLLHCQCMKHTKPCFRSALVFYLMWLKLTNIYLFKIDIVHKSTQKYKKKNNKILSSKFAYLSPYILVLIKIRTLMTDEFIPWVLNLH